MQLIEVSPNEFKAFGRITVPDNKTETVTVDGNVYSRVIRGTKEIEVSEYPLLYCYELDELKCFGYTAKVWDYDYGFSSFFRDSLKIGYELSSNNYVYYWQALFHSGKLPKWIKNVYTDKKTSYVRYGLKPFCLWEIASYGFNNYLYAEIDWCKVFEIENKHECWQIDELQEYLLRFSINIYATNETQQVNNAIKLLIKQKSE